MRPTTQWGRRTATAHERRCGGQHRDTDGLRAGEHARRFGNAWSPNRRPAAPGELAGRGSRVRADEREPRARSPWRSGVAPAAADTAPVDPLPETVSAAALPTVQINGVVWNQVIVGNRVYATGQFSQARPAGAAANTNQTPRSNILAYDLTTGVLITDWAPTLNAQGMELAASADGRTIYVGGDFTLVNNTARNRIAALDAQTGELLPFNPGANGRVDALALNGNTVYFGGNFTTAGRTGTPTGVVARMRLAAADATSGAVLPWNPTADNQVLSMVYHQGTGRVIVAGKFDNLNSTQQWGMGSLDGGDGRGAPMGREHGDPEPRQRLGDQRADHRRRARVRHRMGVLRQRRDRELRRRVLGRSGHGSSRLGRRWSGRQLRHHRRGRRALHGRPPARLGDARLESAVRPVPVPTHDGDRQAPFADVDERVRDLEHLGVRREARGAAAALAADVGQRFVHRPEPSRVERRVQRRLHRAGRGVPAGERHEPAGPRAVRQARDLAHGRPDPELLGARADGDAVGFGHRAHRLEGGVGPRQRTVDLSRFCAARRPRPRRCARRSRPARTGGTGRRWASSTPPRHRDRVRRTGSG